MRTTSPARCSTRPSTTCRGSTTSPATATMPWSEVCTIVGKRRFALPPLFTAWAAEPLRMLRIVDLPPEVLSLLRYGRGVDNSPFKRSRVPLPLQHRRNRRRLRSRPAPRARGRREAPRLQVRERRRDVLPALAGRRSRRHLGEALVPELHIERRGRVAVLTLDDPERRNALTQPLVDALTQAVADARSRRRHRRDRRHRRGTGVLLGCRRQRPDEAQRSGRGCARRPGDLRRVPPGAGVPAADDRGGQRTRRRRRVQPRAGV